MIELNKYIDRRSKTNILKQLFESFRTDILEGRYPAKMYLPSLEELSQIIKVSVRECEKVYDQLIKENLILMDRGNYLSNMHPVSSDFFDQMSDFQMIIESRNLTYSITESKIVSVDYDPDLHPEEFMGKDLFQLNRKYFGNKQCLIYSQTISSRDLLPLMASKQSNDTSTYAEFFVQDQIKSMHIGLTMSLRKLSDDIAKIMGQPINTSCSMSENLIHTEGNLMQYSKIWMIGAGFRFDFTSELIERPDAYFYQLFTILDT